MFHIFGCCHYHNLKLEILGGYDINRKQEYIRSIIKALSDNHEKIEKLSVYIISFIFFFVVIFKWKLQISEVETILLSEQSTQYIWLLNFILIPSMSVQKTKTILVGEKIQVKIHSHMLIIFMYMQISKITINKLQRTLTLVTFIYIYV